ncbi:hypothetical protein CsSME_00043527 [Camellia sinensis var. sinensis]
MWMVTPASDSLASLGSIQSSWKVLWWRPILSLKLGQCFPQVGESQPDVRHFVAASIFSKRVWWLSFFIFGSSLGAYLLLYHLAYTTLLPFPLLFSDAHVSHSPFFFLFFYFFYSIF